MLINILNRPVYGWTIEISIFKFSLKKDYFYLVGMWLQKLILISDLDFLTLGFARVWLKVYKVFSNLLLFAKKS